MEKMPQEFKKKIQKKTIFPRVDLYWFPLCIKVFRSSIILGSVKVFILFILSYTQFSFYLESCFIL